METDPSRFIELATRPVAENERIAASDELTARLAHAGSSEGEDALEGATQRLASRRPSPSWSLPLFAALSLVILASALGFLLPQHWKEARLLEPIHHQGSDKRYYERLLEALGPAAADVPLPVPSWEKPELWEKRFGALLREMPDEPAAYAIYIDFYPFNGSRGVLPADYDAVWQRLDPGNAAWPLEAATRHFAQATRGKPVVLPGNEATFQEALAAFRVAAACDHVNVSRYPILRRQLRSFHPDGSLRDQHIQRHLGSLVGRDVISSSQILDMAEVESARLEAHADREGQRKLMADLRRVLIMVAGDPAGDPSYFSMMMGRKTTALAVRCRSMGLTSEAEWLDRCAGLRPARKAVGMARSAADLVRQSATLHRGTVGFYEPSLPPALLAPGRLAEYAVADRFAVVTGAAFGFLILAACCVEVVRRGKGARGLARGLMPLFRPVYWLWLCLAGVLLPVAWWSLIVHFTPLGMRDIALNYCLFRNIPLMQPWLSQDAGVLVLIWIALFQVARWRVGKRYAFLSIRPSRMWIGWVMVALAALFIPAQGIARYLLNSERFLLFGSAAGGIPLLWLIWQALALVFRPREGALDSSLHLRVLIPAMAALSLAMLAAIPFFRTIERRMVAQDELSKPAPDESGFTILEQRCSEPLREAVLKALR
jgi:hypothetical protein